VTRCGYGSFFRSLSLLQIDSVPSATFAFSSSTNHDVEPFFARKRKNDVTRRWKSVAKPLKNEEVTPMNEYANSLKETLTSLIREMAAAVRFFLAFTIKQTAQG
jgi:hypothetical protein